jgi:transcriptional regulator with XRE-family HTH domain
MEKAEFSFLFGAYIRQLRNKRKMTQPELADKLGNNFQNISAMERGEFTITIFTAYKIAIAFDISLSTLFKDYEEFLVSRED